MELDSYLSDKSKKKKKRRVYIYLAGVFVIVYFVFAVVLWVVLRSPLFRVTSIAIEGNERIADGDVMAVLQSSALRDHNFFKALLGFSNMLLWPSSLSASDLAFAPRAAAVTVSKDYFSRTITANVVERKPVAIWCFMPKLGASGHPVRDEACYWFDDQGIAFERTFDTQGSLMFAIHDYSQSDPGLSGKILPDPFILNLISIVNAVRVSGIDAKEIALNKLELQEIDITTYDGPDLYFSLRFPADNDLPVLESLMAKSDFGKLQYVDFRVENRAYYK